MSKIRTIYFIIALIVSVILGILVIMPDIIPSLVFVQQIIIFVLYSLNIVCAYMIIVRFRNYVYAGQNRRVTAVLTGLITIFIIGGLFLAFIITSLGIGQGFMGGSLAKELDYPTQKVKIYLYDDSFLDPLTTVKIKNKFWPFMHDVAFIENCQPAELKIWRHNNLVELSYDNIVVKINLKTREARKVYIPKAEAE